MIPVTEACFRQRLALGPRGVFLPLVVVAFGCSAPARVPLDAHELEGHARQHQARLAEDTARHTRTLRTRMGMESSQTPEPATFDVLMLSGGGQYGAFGAGVLRGWAAVEEPEFALPRFDVVTGVSTGALIAPFAFAGSVQELEKAEHYYREARQDLALLRGALYFLPWRGSFFDVGGLHAALDEEIGTEELEALRAGHAEGRLLLVATTDLDLGVMRIWDLGHEASAPGDDATVLRRLRRLLLASAAIPAAFPPVEIDGHLHADGAISEDLFLPHDAVSDSLTAPADGTSRPPRVRIWAVVNGRLTSDLGSAGTSWPSIAARSSHIGLHLALATELRRVELFARWLEEAAHAEVEFRYLAIPSDFALPPRDPKCLFEPGLMNRLADLGEALGRDPASWRSDPPRPENLLPSGRP